MKKYIILFLIILPVISANLFSCQNEEAADLPDTINDENGGKNTDSDSYGDDSSGFQEDWESGSHDDIFDHMDEDEINQYLSSRINEVYIDGENVIHKTGSFIGMATTTFKFGEEGLNEIEMLVEYEADDSSYEDMIEMYKNLDYDLVEKREGSILLRANQTRLEIYADMAPDKETLKSQLESVG